jgi:hypothetical protein
MNDYPIIELHKVQATLTPDGWKSDNDLVQQLMELDRLLNPFTGYAPYPLNEEATQAAARVKGKVIHLMPEEPAVEGRIY